METKVCTKCENEFPLSGDYFSVRKDSKDGFRNECKECKSQYIKNYYVQNKTNIIEKNCEYRKANWDSFTENRKKYEEANKEVMTEKRKLYYQENKQIISSKKRVYALKNKGKFAQYYLEWARENVTKCKIKRHKREALIKNLESNLTKEQWANAKIAFNNSCAYCGEESTLQQERFIALDKGGEYSAANIIPACQSCNCSKGNRDFFEWYPRFRHYSKEREKYILDYLGYHNGIQQLALV